MATEIVPGVDSLALVTLLLVLVTGYYAMQTRRTVSEMRKATVAQFRPHLKLSLDFMGPVSIMMKITNVGRGAALNVDIRFWTSRNNIKQWSVSVLEAGDYERFFIPTTPGKHRKSMNYFKQNPTVLKMEGSHTDIPGENHQVEDEIDLTRFVKQVAGVSQLYREPELQKIAREIEKMRRTLKKIEQKI